MVPSPITAAVLPGGKAAAQHGVAFPRQTVPQGQPLFKADGGCGQGIQSAGLYGDCTGPWHHFLRYSVQATPTMRRLCAEVVHPVGAEPASSRSIRVESKGDAVAHAPALHGFAQLRNGAAGFVAHDQRRDAPPVLTAAGRAHRCHRWRRPLPSTSTSSGAGSGRGTSRYSKVCGCGGTPVLFIMFTILPRSPSSCLQTGFFQLCGVWALFLHQSLVHLYAKAGLLGQADKAVHELEILGCSAHSPARCGPRCSGCRCFAPEWPRCSRWHPDSGSWQGPPGQAGSVGARATSWASAMAAIFLHSVRPPGMGKVRCTMSTPPMASRCLKSYLVNRRSPVAMGMLQGRRNLGEILHVIAENGFLNEHGVELFQLFGHDLCHGLCAPGRENQWQCQNPCRSSHARWLRAPAGASILA